jgi:hypothetical protein
MQIKRDDGQFIYLYDGEKFIRNYPRQVARAWAAADVRRARAKMDDAMKDLDRALEYESAVEAHFAPPTVHDPRD